MSDLTTQIETASAQPKQVSSDAGTVIAHSLAEQIEADRYLKSVAAAASAKRGFVIAKFKPNGSE